LKSPLSKLLSGALLGLLLTSCTGGEKIRWLVKLNPNKCQECLEEVQKEVPSFKPLKSYRSVKCLFLVELPPEEAERLKEFKECVEYLEPDRKLRLIE